MLSPCEQVRNEYEALKTLKEAFTSELHQDPSRRDMAKILKLQAELEQRRDALWEKIDPYQTNLRRRLASVLQADYIGVFSKTEGVALVEKDGKYFFIDKTGKKITEEEFDEVGSFSEGVAVVAKIVKGRKQYFFIDKTGREITKKRFDSAWSFSEGVALVRKDDKYFFIDKTGKEITEEGFDYAGSFSEGVAVVEKDGKYFFIDKTGKKITEEEFDEVKSFSEGVAWVAKIVKGRKQYFFIDKTGKKIIKERFDDAWSFSEDVAWVKKDGKWFYIDRKGRRIFS